MSRVNTPNLDSWNPMQEDFEDRDFNSYAGRCLYENLAKVGMQQPRSANYGYDVFALHVRRIPLTMSEVGLRNLFSKSGVVLDVKVLWPPGMPSPSYLYGKVYFRSSQEAIKGLQELHDTPPLYLKVELDRHDFRMNGRSHETPRLPIQSYPGNVLSGGRGLLPTPCLSIQGQPEIASRTVCAHQNWPVNKGAAVTQGYVGSRSTMPASIKDARCVKCQSKGSKCCTRCKTIYCSLACQKADWEQHKYVCVSLKVDAITRPYILEDPPQPKQSPTSVSGHSDNSPNRPHSLRVDQGTGSDVQPCQHLQGSFRPEQRGEPSPPRQAFIQSSSQQQQAGDRKFQPRPNSGKQNSPQKVVGDGRDQHRPAASYAKNGQQSVGEARGNSWHHSQAAGDRKDQQKPIGSYANNGQQHPHPEAGKQNSKQKSADNAGDRKDSQDEQQKGSYKPLRRPNPPQTSAPKASRLIKPQKLCTIQTVTLGVSTKVKIAHIGDPYNFYVHLDKEDDLADIMRKVQAVDRDPPLEEVTVGQIVAAKFSLDGVWYRARVEKAEKDKISVNFIDYGNVDVMMMQDLRYLNSEIAELPTQAVWCRLSNVQPTKGRWSTDAVRCFKVITENIELLATLEKTHVGQAWITMKEDSVGDTGELLVTTGLATKRLPVHGSCLEGWKSGAEITLATPTLEKSGKIWANHMAGIPTDQVAVLFSELGKACASVEDARNPEQFVEGAVVAAQSPSDEVWYRGVILQADTNEYLVRYLDFGNCEIVNNLRLLPAAFCQYLTLGICFRVEEPYASECVPDEFLPDDILIAKVLRLTGDSATVSVQFGEGSHTIQAVASSIWKLDDGFDFSDSSLEEIDSQVAAAVARLQVEELSLTDPPQVTKPCHSVTPTKNFERPCSVKPSSPSIIDKGLGLLPKLEIPFDPVVVVPSWVESLDRISVQFLEVDKMTLLQKLTVELQEACQGKVLGSLTKLPATGQLVCSQFSLDGMWNRCLVEEVNADGGITVRFIDYGNTEVARLDSLQPLPNSFYETCPMALNVSIEAVTTLTLESLREVLTPVAAEVVPLVMTVTDRAADPIRVSLTTDDGRSLEDLLVEFAASCELETNEVTGATVSAASPVPQVEAMEEPELQAVIEQEEAVQATQASEDAPESHVSDSEPMATTPSCVQLEVGQCLDLCIGGIHAPDLIMVMKCDFEELSIYDKMAEDITQHCTIGAPSEYDPKEGDFCLAKSNTFNQWFRALVTGFENGKCSVLFPDYGNSEVVEMSDTRPMTEAFQNTPFQAVSCSILGVEPKEDEYNAVECEAFKAFLTSLEFIPAEVVKKESGDFYVIRVPSIETELKKLGFMSG